MPSFYEVQKDRISSFTSNRFARSVGLLVGGTAFAQLLTVLALPVLTRLYSPEEFSVLAFYIAIVSLLSVVACLRLEIAIPIPEDDIEAANLLVLALVTTVIFSVLLCLSMFCWAGDIFRYMKRPEFVVYAWLVPFGVLLAGSYAALQFWATRKEKFKRVAKTRVMQAFSGLGCQLVLGAANVGSLGLLLGHALNSGSGGGGLFRSVWKEDRLTLSKVTFSGMLEALRKYKNFPVYSTLESLANSAAIQVPIIIIASVAAGPEAGFVLLAMRALGTPVTLLGNSISQVYLSKAADKDRTGQLSVFTLRVVTYLALFGAAPLLLCSLAAPAVFAFVFGEEWRRAGELVVWMAPWFALKLLASPVSMVMHVKMLQRAMLYLMLGGLFVRVGMTLFAYLYFPERLVEFYALSGGIHYAIALMVYLYAAMFASTAMKQHGMVE